MKEHHRCGDCGRPVSFECNTCGNITPIQYHPGCRCGLRMLPDLGVATGIVSAQKAASRQSRPESGRAESFYYEVYDVQENRRDCRLR